ncbi:uncharacterized protein N7515_003814 [Penicillium bovifimosum]|uniref:Uncharacterized protein n=1 Tax=Penicillium bovifimosum TaxID=126998 RepID=A0A9W9H769_9EURO|nr:uncharacterized protein N7515_003814 [Penicillium bovifimosum]KAJ5138966.1 hypothetical protein N7515_003814 [Penicillium bovifimosum]
MTINKSQGQSLKMVGVNLRVPAFSRQLYVALRVTDVANLSVLLAEGSDKTENVVYPEVVQRFHGTAKNLPQSPQTTAFDSAKFMKFCHANPIGKLRHENC